MTLYDQEIFRESCAPLLTSTIGAFILINVSRLLVGWFFKEVSVFDRFDFTDDGDYYRVLVVKLGKIRIASYSNRLGFSVWRVR